MYPNVKRSGLTKGLSVAAPYKTYQYYNHYVFIRGRGIDHAIMYL